MNDTRLWGIKDSLEDTMRRVRSITDGPRPKNINEAKDAHKLLRNLVDAHRLVVGLMHPDIPLCLFFSTVGSCCYRQQDHEGAHQSEWGSTWTTEGDRQYANAIAKSMEGRRD